MGTHRYIYLFIVHTLYLIGIGLFGFFILATFARHCMILH